MRFGTDKFQTYYCTQPPFQWVLGDLSLGIKRPGRGADHSPPSSAEVKKIRGAIPPLPNSCNGKVLSSAQRQLYLYICLTTASYQLQVLLCVYRQKFTAS
jgi:hypothetical protein